MSAIRELGGIKTIIGSTFSLGDALNSLLGEAFPKTTDGIDAYVTAIKNAEGATGKFKASFTGLGAAMKANPVGAVIAGIAALIGVIKIVDNIIDEAHDNIDDTIAKKDAIIENISDINNELEEVDNQIAELENKKLNITDSNDISTLNTQIELLKQRKELLELKAKNEQKENEKEANNLIQETKNDSVYTGASYMDGKSGKLSKKKKFFYSLGGAEAPPTYSAESYVDSLEKRLSSIHPENLENVIDNLSEIYDTYDKITQDDTLIDTESYDIAIEKQKKINELIRETQYLQSVRNDLDKEYLDDADFSSYLGGYTLYQNNLNSLIQKGYSNGLITIEDIKNQFGNYTSNLENDDTILPLVKGWTTDGKHNNGQKHLLLPV